jgi:hypothetical protein
MVWDSIFVRAIKISRAARSYIRSYVTGSIIIHRKAGDRHISSQVDDHQRILAVVCLCIKFCLDFASNSSSASTSREVQIGRVNGKTVFLLWHYVGYSRAVNLCATLYYLMH